MSTPTPWTVTRAWGVHLFTSSGVVCSFLTVTCALNDQPRAALLWLMVAQVVDGVDGPLARGWDVRSNVPLVSGHVLDLIVDFTTCVFAPVLFAWWFHLLPADWETPLLLLVLVTSVLWFSREDIETRDLWFRGFPTAWNLVFTVFWITELPDWAMVCVTVVLCVLTLTPWFKVPHVMGAPQLRPVTLTLSILGLIAMVVLIVDRETPGRPIALGIIAVWFAWYFGVGLWRSLQGDELVPEPADVAV